MEGFLVACRGAIIDRQRMAFCGGGQPCRSNLLEGKPICRARVTVPHRICPAFRNFILGVILFNALILGLQTSKNHDGGGRCGLLDPSSTRSASRSSSSRSCLKFIRASAWRFFNDPWNVFDFIDRGRRACAEHGRLQRPARAEDPGVCCASSPWRRKLRRVVQGFVSALPGMASVILLMAIIFYIGAVMSTRLYGDTHPQWFGTVGESLYSLFQIMTLESWSMGIVRPVMEVHPQAWAFFVPFITLTSFMTVNLVVGLDRELDAGGGGRGGERGHRQLSRHGAREAHRHRSAASITIEAAQAHARGSRPAPRLSGVAAGSMQRPHLPAQTSGTGDRHDLERLSFGRNSHRLARAHHRRLDGTAGLPVTFSAPVTDHARVRRLRGRDPRRGGGQVLA